MPEQPTSDATPSTPDAHDAHDAPDAAAAATPDGIQPAGQPAAQPAGRPTAPAPLPAEAPKSSDSTSKKKKILSAIATVAVLLVVKFGLASVFAEDPTHGVAVGQCVAADGSDDFTQVDCGSSDSLGKVTFVAKDAETSEKAALDLCAQHGADSAYTAADTTGGKGTVVCVSGS